ncbi:DNA-directed RNA polymerase I subunit RPA43 [Leptodactylus fuscus]|uniref:DNA-directed RNA polymerase I subunit RPA43 n=1 Tax=Leptodactylus fuscus TaxID=238119 RepID=UPI003F4E9F2C
MAAPDNPGSTAPAGAASRALSCLALPSFTEACGFINSKYSCLVVKTHRRHLALHPKYLNKKRSGIKEHLNADLLKYSVTLEGVPVAYDNIKLVGELGEIVDDIGYIHINIEADFVVFQPKCGQNLVGVVNKKAPSHIGCLVHGCFNASIPRPLKISVEAWQQMEADIGDQLEFEVFRMDADAVGVFCIRGRLNKKMEAELVNKINSMAEDQNTNVILRTVQNGSEISEEGAVVETSTLSEDTLKKIGKKRTFEETLSLNESTGEQGDANFSLEEAPKKKQKKHDHQEAPSQDQPVEVDGSGDNSVTETSFQPTEQILNREKRKKKKHKESLQDIAIDVALDHSAVGLDSESGVPSSLEHHVKKSKKKKHKDHPDLESSLVNGVTEDSLTLEDSTLEEAETQLLGSTKKKHKKKHKNAPLTPDLDPGKGIALTSSQETSTDVSITQQETPQKKKHKKKHQDLTVAASESAAFQTTVGIEDSNNLVASSQRKEKKRKKESL